MPQWLQKHHMYIESNSLGTTNICTVRYLFNIQPSKSYHGNIKKHIYNKFEKVTSTTKEAQALDTYAKEYHNKTCDKTFIPPFKIYITSTGHGNWNVRVETKMIGIKSNIACLLSSKKYSYVPPSPASPPNPLSNLYTIPMQP